MQEKRIGISGKRFGSLREDVAVAASLSQGVLL
jgi:hypothetical protein